MKKILAMLLAGVMLLTCLVACGKKDDKNDDVELVGGAQESVYNGFAYETNKDGDFTIIGYRKETTSESTLSIPATIDERPVTGIANGAFKANLAKSISIPEGIVTIGDTAFYKNYMELERKLFLSFSIRLPRKEASLDFWQFLKGGETRLLNTVIAGTVTDAQLTEKGEAAFSTNFFRAQGCVAGDHRVELTKQSFLPAPDYEGEDPSPKIKANVLKTLKNGTLDYIVFDESALDTLILADLMTLTEVGQLPETGILYDGDRPVAVELAALGFEGAEGKAYIAFSANTKRLDICKELWDYISK
jgi:hypothetical protein